VSGGGRIEGEAVAIAGASGTIGRALVAELGASGRDALALGRRPVEGFEQWPSVATATVDFTEPDALARTLSRAGADTVVSCMASRSGSPLDAQLVDYAANSALLRAAIAAGARRFVLLSAICVQRPLLAFQHAKLAFEAELIAAPIEHTIVRPTAYFKSLAGQAGRVAKGKPFLLFGDGELTRCKPISDRDLARFLAQCIDSEEAHGAILPIGGAGPAVSLRDCGTMLFEEAGREPRFRSVPPGMFVLAARVLGCGAPVSPWLAAKSEYARIAHYYATQSMLVLDPGTGRYDADATPEFGADSLRAHYRSLLQATQ
jgi:divinyl chlorophyllide a 8-vinyl-reductase